MDNQRIGRLLRILGACERTALRPGLRVLQTVLIGNLRQTQALHTYSQPGLIHHGKHVPHAPMLLSHQVTHGSIKAELASGRALDAHLLLQRPTDDGVSLAQGVIIVDPVLGDQEQTYALDARRRVRETSQNQMDDVLREVLVAGGDEYLVSPDQVTAVLPRLSLGTNQAQIGTAL